MPAGGRLLLVSDPDSTASALLRVLAGLSPADGGRIRIAGSSDSGSGGWGRRVAYVGPNPGLRAWMTPLEVLRLAGDLLDLPAAERARRGERVTDWAGIPAAALAQPMSRGGVALQQRTALAAALLGDPEVLLLDEPLRAIDPEERRRLLGIRGRRRTVLLASRRPASEAGLAAHVAYMRVGRVELIAAMSDLDAAGLPLSRLGIEALVDRRAAGTNPVPRRAPGPV